MKALIVTGRMVQDQEMAYPFYRLQEAGYEVTVAAERTGEFHGIQGVKFQADAELAYEAEVQKHYNILVIPGGVKCMEHLRLNQYALEIVKRCHKGGAIVAAICSGTQMLISAKLVKGRHVSGYYAIKDDIENAGGIFVDAPAVVEDRIVTSPHYRYLGAWMSATLQAAGYT